MINFSTIKSRYRYSYILLKELVITDFKLRYQGSFLGYLWSLLKPLFLFTVLYFVFVGFLKIGNDIPNWPIAMLLGIILWTFFSEVTNNGLASIVSRGDVIRKINFPKYIIVISGSLSAVINLAINLVVVFVLMLINGVGLHFSMLILPILIIELFVFGLGIAFILSSIYVKFRDIQYIWEIIMQGLFYGSAVIYPISMVVTQSEFMSKVLMLNPIAQIIQDTRHLVVNQANPLAFDILNGNYLYYMIPYTIVTLIFLFGAVIFKRKSPYFAENV